jgi:hypothetical protein
LRSNIAAPNPAPWLVENYKPLDFSNITRAPRDIPEKSIDKLLIFQGNNAVPTQDHWNAFMTVIK